MKRYLLLTLILLSILASWNFTKPAQTALNIRPEPSSSLRFLAIKSGIEIGTAVEYRALTNDENYQATLAREFNTLMPENEMKFQFIHPERSRYDFTQADAIVQFGQKHNMKVFGHTLLWYLSLPDWLKQGDFSRAEMIEILHDHIDTIVKHYKGQIIAWDAVNEAISRDGSLRDSIWLRKIGPEYLDLVFEWAHAADPKARLFFNEFSAEELNPKSDGLYAVVASMKQRGIPITGVGLQMHKSLGSPPNAEKIAKNIKRFTDLGLEVQITEMDIKLGDGKGTRSQRLQKQAKIYGDVLNVCLSFPQCKTFMFWGFTDRYSWINRITGTQDGPLIFDQFYQAKPAYQAIASVLAR